MKAKFLTAVLIVTGGFLVIGCGKGPAVIPPQGVTQTEWPKVETKLQTNSNSGAPSNAVGQGIQKGGGTGGDKSSLLD